MPVYIMTSYIIRTPTTAVGTTAATGFPATWAFDYTHPYRPWRATDCVATTTGLYLDYGAAYDFSYVIIDNVNVTSVIVDTGGGTSEVAVISLGGIVISRSLRVAGDEMDMDIVQYMRNKYNLLIGERMGEQAKIAIGSATHLPEEMTMTLRGRNLVTGLPEAPGRSSILRLSRLRGDRSRRGRTTSAGALSAASTPRRRRGTWAATATRSAVREW